MKYVFTLLMIIGCSSSQETVLKSRLGVPISWGDRLPIKLYIQKEVPVEYRKYIYKAAKTWEDGAGLKLFEITEYTPVQLGFNFMNGIYYMKFPVQQSDELGSTMIYSIHDRILDTDLKINNSYKFYLTDENKGDYNFESLILHELGHVLGLGHYENSVMNEYLPKKTNITTLTEQDKKYIRMMYGKENQ